jgi:hypothetical protein
MNGKLNVGVPFLLLLGATVAVPAEEIPPRVFVDKDACPFECCEYGKWTAESNAQAYSSPDKQKASFTISTGTTLLALTGYVRTVGQPFLVTRDHAPYKVGEKLVVYTYYGEGAFLVWYKGKKYTEDLGFSPYGGTGGTRCTDARYCWGTLGGELESDWWVHVQLNDGTTTWLHGATEFSGADRCG